MINSLFIYSPRGDLLITKVIKDSVRKTSSLSEVFRIQIISDSSGVIRSPILTLGSTTFHHIRKNKLWIVAVTRNNVDSALIWEFLFRFSNLLENFGINNDDSVRDKFTLVYDLLHCILSIDGVPYDTELSNICSKLGIMPVNKNVISGSSNGSSTADSNGISINGSNSNIMNSGNNSNSSNNRSIDDNDFFSSLNPKNFGKFLDRKSNSNSSSNTALNSYNNTTSDIPWRPNLDIKYKKNEIFLDIIENINILISKEGDILKSYIDGVVEMQCKLSGMPVVQLKLNDEQQQQKADDFEHYLDLDMKKRKKGIPDSAVKSVHLDDYKFHQCVQLNKFHTDCSITFVPPDGNIELMTYHVKEYLNLPFSIQPIVTSNSRTNSVHYSISLKSLFSSKLNATDVVLKIPLPQGTLECNSKASNGKCKYSVEEKMFYWRFNKFRGSTENMLQMSARLSENIIFDLNKWNKPAISLKFEILMFTCSGLTVKYCNVRERSNNYRTTKWIKYISKAGSYEVRY
ncbi:related to AP-2 complex subunit mu [Saccharomycodes ludwigii]|uniref:Related to AP-2 complex subunit mu n=1 Tax=Saccharomycodes ludwigii TaxID=36035 RepID=A0A376B5H3_9ASCO|nr:hypothetical protein SCDLUD_002511 [Saccharomycodes ludwigii]KAH3901037.1 hypothetical protein SCDLUD_002511 [Saccharomycodes ludwigii]SSD59724.1 related to AP-2 complex subunit mu [Saccharomycodes ludwigii]